jgi:hypothetical protein
MPPAVLRALVGIVEDLVAHDELKVFTDYTQVCPRLKH